MHLQSFARTGLFRFLLIGTCLLACCAWAAEEAGQAASAEQTESPLAPRVDLTSPRGTVATFFKAMTEVKAGEKDRLADALTCIYFDPAVLSEQERIEQGPEVAQRLFEILDSTTIDLDLVPTEFEGDNYELRIDHDHMLTLHRYKDDGGVWRFSYENTVKRMEAIHEEVVEEAREEKAEKEKELANPKLATPRASMQTFIEGMNRWEEGGKEDALSTLDLSAIDAPVQAVEGERLAAMLKEVLDRHEEVVYVKLPNDPDREDPYVYLDDPKGRIVLAPIKNEETGQAEWKFSAKTLESLTDLYDAFKAKARVVAPPAKGPRVVSLVVRDWVGARSPFLLKKTALIENWQWLGMFLIILAGFSVSRFIAFLMILLLHRTVQRQDIDLDRDIEKEFIRPIRIAVMAWVWWLGLNVLGLPPKTMAILLIAAKSLTAGAAVWAFYRLIDLLGDYLYKRAEKTESKYDDLLVPLVTRTLKIFTIAFGLVFVAEALTLPVKSLLAGLGLGGLAFALAAKDTIANIFGSLTVLLDRPFHIGDWVVIGDVEGSVEAVGIRSTRIRTFYNSLITVPNSNLISASIDNMGARRYRRIKAMLAVAYDTPPEKIDAFCAGIREIIREHPYTRKDYYHVWLNEFGDASLNILLYCFHETPEWATELRERHRLFLDIVRLAQRLGVEFAFPTQTLYVRQDTMPEHEVIDARRAQALGRRTASDIVREFQGGKDAPKPPPVDLGMGERDSEWDEEEARNRGGEDLDSE